MSSEQALVLVPVTGRFGTPFGVQGTPARRRQILVRRSFPLGIHVVLGKRDGTALAGQLLEGRVRPTLEVMLTESPTHMRRVHDPETGLPLIRLPG